MRILLLAILLVAADVALSASGTVAELTPNANLFVSNDFIGETLNLAGTNSSILCKTLIANTLTANVIETQSLELNQISANSIVSPNGQPIQFQGHVQILGSISYNQGTASKSNIQLDAKRKLQNSFIVVDDLIIAGVKQWKAIDHESFNSLSDKMLFSSTKEINGWTLKKTQPLPLFLKGSAAKTNEFYPENEGSDKMMSGASGEEISKTFKNLPAHGDVMIEAQFHFLSPFWRGQAAYLKVDGQYAWIDHHDWSDYNVEDACEFDEKNIEDYKYSVPINVILAHNSDEMKIEIGITKTKDDLSECENELYKNKNLLFGVDDFLLNVK